MLRRVCFVCAGLSAWFGSAGLLHAQDTRRVSEPSVPPACAVLEARLTAPAGVLSEESERSPDTSRIQGAIDACAPGKAVVLARAGEKDVFLAGPLRLRPGVALVVAARTSLFASRNPRDYDVEPGSCGILRPVDKRGPGCRPLILAEDAPGSAVMGPGAIDGRGGAKLAGDDRSWWELAKQAKVLDMQQSCPRLLVVRRSNGFVLYRITLRSSPNLHVVAEQTDGFTAWGVRIKTPKTARNTDGIDPSSSTNVTIAHSFIDTGDDDVAIKSGPAGPAAHITIAHNHFYSGHGMSIGSGTSGGVSAVRVSDLTIDGADNGLRIKSDRSRGGLVEDVAYQDVCLRNVANPIVLTTMYTTFPGDRPPVYRKILLEDVRSVTSGWSTILGLPEHRIDVALDNVSVDGQRPGELRAEHADVRIGPRRGSFLPSGETVSVDDAGATAAEPLRCEGRFVPFPDDSEAPAAAITVPPEDATLYVAADGTGDYYSIQRAIDVAPETGATISVAPGIYRERLTITKRGIRMRSPYQDASRTVVVFDASAASAGSTLKSATVAVRASDFVAENVSFANDWNASHPQLPQGSQAVALLVTGDRAAFRNVRILGNQDTLYVGSTNCEGPDGAACTPARAYFERCLVQGNVDFIFGDGKAFFDRCEIRSTPHEIGFVTAHGRRDEAQAGAFVFRRCSLTAEPGVRHVWLGRPWRDRARVVFLDTEIGEHVEPAGWREWHPGETNRLETAFFAERGSTGAGARLDRREPRARTLRAEEAEGFTLPVFLAGQDGWHPEMPSSLLLAPAAHAGDAAVRLRVTNALDAPRAGETVELMAATLEGRVEPQDLPQLRVTDVRTGRELLAQAVDQDGDDRFDLLVFQMDFAPGETRELALVRGEARKHRLEDYRVYGRFVRERQDDFAWENDRVAFRVYGPALETFAKEPLTSSAVDAWSKRTTRLVLNDWYLADDYHRDHGEGGDFYPAGKTRGCGGSGLVTPTGLAVSRNFRGSRVLASGPIRLVFELDYPAWDALPNVKEQKRVTLDAGSHFNKFESFYTRVGEAGAGAAGAGEAAITWAAGVRKAEDAQSATDRERGFVRTWEFQGRYGDGGRLGCAVVMDPAQIVDVTEADGNLLLVARTPAGTPARWYAGSGWDRSGAFPDAESWDRHVRDLARRLASPLRIEVVAP